MAVMNLDLEAARAAQGVMRTCRGEKKETVENVATKALGVVQEAGVYSGLLFLFTRGQKEGKVARAVRDELLALAKKLRPSETEVGTSDAALKWIAEEVCADLDRVLLVKQVWELALVYCRYGAKAME